MINISRKDKFMPTIKRKDVRDKYMSALTPEDRDIIRLKVEILREIVKNRKEQGMTQKELGEITGFAQAFIARIENFKSNPQLDTVLNLLRSLGKTLAVVPISAVDKDGMVVAEYEIDSTVEHRSEGVGDLTTTVSSSVNLEDDLVIV